MRATSRITGYEGDIYRGVWERVKVFGALRTWSHVWTASCCFVGLYLLTYWGFKWVALPFCAWLVGHLTLVALTSWNSNWDEMMRAQWARRYKGCYRAG